MSLLTETCCFQSMKPIDFPNLMRFLRSFVSRVSRFDEVEFVAVIHDVAPTPLRMG